MTKMEKTKNNDNKNNNDLSELKLNGKVKTLIEIKFNVIVKDGIIKAGDQIISKRNFIFNEIGDQIEKKLYNTDISVYGKSRYKWDDNGNKIEHSIYDSSDRLESKSTFKYDEKSNEIEWNCFISNGSLDIKYTYKYDYDETGNWIKKIEFNKGIPKNITTREIEYF